MGDTNTTTIEIDGQIRHGRNIDGIKSGARKPVITPRATAVPIPHKVQIASEAKSETKPTTSSHRTAASHHKAHTPQHSQTLMRRAVKKPAAPTKPAVIKVSGPSAVTKTTIVPKLSVTNLDNDRLEHAQSIPKSEFVQRFNPIEPAVPLVATSAPQPQAPVAAGFSPTPASQLPADTTAGLLQRVLEQSASHEQPSVPPKRSKRTKRLVTIGATTAVLLLLLGVAGYQNIGNIQLKLASAKAGFTAALPADRPAGFSLSNVSSAAGVVTASFHSNAADDRNYTLTEKPSSWDSATLRDNAVAPVDSQYEVTESGGRTIYLYNGDSATWVNNGIWYTVVGNGSLSNQQLVALATSI